MSATEIDSRNGVATSIRSTPIIGVVRTATEADAETQARNLIAAGIELIEITFSCPQATGLVSRLLAGRSAGGPPWIGMGTVTSPERAAAALAAGAEFLVTPNTRAETAAVALAAGVFLIIGALTPTEIAAARDMGADMVKVYPLPPVGGAAYLATVRQPLSDIPMLAAGGFAPEEIPDYWSAGARGFGIGAPILGATADEIADRVRRALESVRGTA